MKGWVIALIVVAGVVVLISVEIFIFEMVKLNKQDKQNGGGNNNGGKQ